MTGTTLLLLWFYLKATMSFLGLDLGTRDQMFKEPDFIAVSYLRLKSLGLKESQVKLGLQYYNPNAFSIRLSRAEMDIYLNNRYAGHATLDTLIQIPARDSFLLPVKGRVDMSHLLANAWVLASRREVELGLKGWAKMGKGVFLLRIPVDYKGMHSLGLF